MEIHVRKSSWEENGMKIGIGIDTGGTYTDAVLYDFHSKTVLAKAKALLEQLEESEKRLKK